MTAELFVMTAIPRCRKLTASCKNY